jgi:hypothetical protein
MELSADCSPFSNGFAGQSALFVRIIRKFEEPRIIIVCRDLVKKKWIYLDLSTECERYLREIISSENFKISKFRKE